MTEAETWQEPAPGEVDADGYMGEFVIRSTFPYPVTPKRTVMVGLSVIPVLIYVAISEEAVTPDDWKQFKHSSAHLTLEEARLLRDALIKTCAVYEQQLEADPSISTRGF